MDQVGKMSSQHAVVQLVGTGFPKAGFPALFYTNSPAAVSIWVTGIVGEANPTWCQRVYEARAAGLILYGRALGLSHGEAEDVLQETFLALMQLTERPI